MATVGLSPAQNKIRKTLMAPPPDSVLPLPAAQRKHSSQDKQNLTPVKGERGTTENREKRHDEFIAQRRAEQEDIIAKRLGASVTNLMALLFVHVKIKS